MPELNDMPNREERELFIEGRDAIELDAQPVEVAETPLAQAVFTETSAETVKEAEIDPTLAQTVVVDPVAAQSVLVETEVEHIKQVAVDPTISQAVIPEPTVEVVHQLEEPVMNPVVTQVAKRSLLGPVLGTLAALGLVSGGVWAATRGEIVDPTVTVTDTAVVREVAAPVVTVTDTTVVTKRVEPVVTASDVVVVETDVVKVVAPTPTVVVKPKPVEVVAVAPVVVENDVETVTVTG